jgi:hypothetical protein
LVILEHRKVVPNNLGSKNPGSYLLRVKVTSPVLSGLNDSSCSLHHPSTEFGAHCMSSDIFSGIYPLPGDKCHPHILEHRSPSLSLVINSFTTRHQSRGDSTPPCGQPLATAILLETSPRVAVARCPSRVALIHRMMVRLTPCLVNSGGVIGGVKCPFCVERNPQGSLADRAPSQFDHELMKSHLSGFPRLVCMLVGMQR